MIQFALVLAAGITLLQEVENPATRGAHVSDMAQMIEDSAEATINQELQTLHDQLGVEVAVVTIEDTDRTPKEFAAALFSNWKLGQAEHDNGLLILMVRDQRRLEMETGYGLEAALPDAWLGEMQREYMVPHFAGGDFGTGLSRGVERVSLRLRESYVPGATPSASARAPESSSTPGIFLFALLAGVASWGGYLLWQSKFKGKRKCPHCKTQMTPLLDDLEDPYLNPQQQLEEKLGAVEHTVYLCPACSLSEIVSEDAEDSGYERCESCAAKTKQVTPVVIETATAFDQGTIELRGSCKSCGHESRTRRAYVLQKTSYAAPPSLAAPTTNPAQYEPYREDRNLQPQSTLAPAFWWGGSSSSSSSSSSAGSSSTSSDSSFSWGGGRSGGGGAGSSW